MFHQVTHMLVVVIISLLAVQIAADINLPKSGVFQENSILLRYRRQLNNQQAQSYGRDRYYFYNTPPNYKRKEHKFYPSPVLIRG